MVQMFLNVLKRGEGDDRILFAAGSEETTREEKRENIAKATGLACFLRKEKPLPHSGETGISAGSPGQVPEV